MSPHVPSTQLPGRRFWLSARGATINVFTTELSRGRQRRSNVARVGTGSPLAPRRGAQPSYDADVQPAPLPRLKVRVASERVASTRWALSVAPPVDRKRPVDCHQTSPHVMTCRPSDHACLLSDGVTWSTFPRELQAPPIGP